MTLFDEARSTITSKYATARTDFEKNFSDALSAIVEGYTSVNTQLEDMLKSPNADANAWANAMSGPIRTAIDDMAMSLVDAQQRGGRIGTTGVGSIISKSLDALMPITSSAVKEAMAYKTKLGLEKVGATERLTTGKAGLLAQKGAGLSTLATEEGKAIAGIQTKEAEENLATERAKDALKNQLLISGLLQTGDARKVASTLGLTQSPLIATGATGGGATTADGGATGSQSIGDILAQIAAANQLMSNAQNSRDLAYHSGTPQQASIASGMISSMGNIINNLSQAAGQASRSSSNIRQYRTLF